MYVKIHETNGNVDLVNIPEWPVLKAAFLCCFKAGMCMYQSRPWNRPRYIHVPKQKEH